LQYRRAPSGAALTDALTIIAGKSQFEGDERSIWTRVADGGDGCLYLDLGTPDWDAVRIGPDGWEVVSRPPVYFRRGQATGALPYPARDGSLDGLRVLLRRLSESDFRKVVGWLLGVYTTPLGRIRCLSSLPSRDPGSPSSPAACASWRTRPVAMRGMPRDERDLVIAAKSNHVLALDNVSTLPGWLSDALCRLATGGGWATRRLYTDADEELFLVQRPVILTGIEDFVVNGDLLDRALILSLPAIPPEERRPERELEREFRAVLPAILGALLDAVSAALRNFDTTTVPTLPRMADFATWVTAAESALPWPAGGFLEAYAENATTARDVALESSIIADAVRDLAVERSSYGWQGTASQLLQDLERYAPEAVRRREWPRTPRKLSGELRRLAPTLRSVGVDISFGREARAGRQRLITIRPTESRAAGHTVHTVHTVRTEPPELPEGQLDRGDVDDVDDVDGQVHSSFAELSESGWTEDV
jgi:hypothetical protein